MKEPDIGFLRDTFGYDEGRHLLESILSKIDLADKNTHIVVVVFLPRVKFGSTHVYGVYRARRDPHGPCQIVLWLPSELHVEYEFGIIIGKGDGVVVVRGADSDDLTHLAGNI